MAGLSQKARCIVAYQAKGFTLEEAKRLCADYPDDAPKAPATSKPKKVATSVATWTVGVKHGAEVPPEHFARFETVASNTGWSAGPGVAGDLGTGAVVFPDEGKAAKDFEKALGRPVKSSDLAGWCEYARRLAIPEKAAERAWKRLVKLVQKPLKSAIEDLRAVFGEELGGVSTIPSVRIFTPKMSHGGPQIEPPPNGTMQKINKNKKKGSKVPTPKPDPSPIAAPEPSFPYHTKEAGKVWKVALKLIALHPTDRPKDILQRSLAKAGVKGIEITPEDEKLLQMAIHYAQNGPPKSLSRIGGAPGGPFNSTGYGHTLAKSGAP